ncbi:hypothetical protein [Candidatus Anaplasma sp. TIGMIC]|uniref:hypothetical protein n=1 Tax=Candidatus Anaplasma sp. TIGMIC TaxID=3020713 RepID=UPI00232F4889|nr:hypothetical protein [Candidatus Anaplasma sp. TIGMIC]MDB1135218.1 hypothetical protein [Candidatus Anaplasma sp. TIGMIC]
MKKIACIALNISAVVAICCLVLKVASSVVAENGVDESGKPYTLKVMGSSGVGYRLGATILRPLVESRIDYHIKEQGLEEYFKSLKAKAIPKSNFTSNDMLQGSGSKAVCGQQITAMIFSLPSPKGSHNAIPSAVEITKLLTNSASSVSFQLGSYSVPEVNYGVVGMKKEGSRVILIENGENAGSHYVSLISIDSSEPTESSLERFFVFDKANPDYSGSEVLLSRCGDVVNVGYNLRDSSGNMLLHNQTATFRVGSRQVPIALDLAAVDLRSDSLRSVIVPPELLTGFDANLTDSGVKILDLWVVPTEGSNAGNPG